MKKKHKFKVISYQKANFTPLIIVACISALLLIATVFLTLKNFCNQKVSRELSELIQQTTDFQHQQNQTVKNTIMHLTKVISTIASQNELDKLINLPDGSPEANSLKKEILAEFKAYIRNFDYCYQIRFLDENGKEVIRINKDNKSQTKVVPVSELQQKQDRYYFKATVGLKPDQVYLSNIDLNVEHNKIERPYVPTIRLAMPLVDKQKHNKGIIIINTKASYILDKIEQGKNFTKGPQMLLNQNGFWLLHPDTAKEWGFMLNKPSLNLKVENPQLWQAINSEGSNTIKTEHGIYLSRKIQIRARDLSFGRMVCPRMDEKYQSTFLLLLSRIEPAVIAEIKERNCDKYKLVSNLTSLIIVLSTILIYSIIRARLKIKHNLIKMAYYDELTGLANRKMFYEQLTHSIDYCNRYGASFAIFYIDLDGFKDVNDKFGHHSGDVALKQVADALNSCIRKSDMAARIGGDEFAVMLQHLNERSDVEALARRIIESVEQLPILKETQQCISTSIGISFFPTTATDEATLLRKADEAMYLSKRQGKATFTIAEDHRN